MIRSLPNSRRYLYSYKLYMGLYFAFLFAPLVVTCVLAFNDSQFPALPWKGFTLEWFTGDLPQRVGIFHDSMNLESIWVSAQVAFFVTILSVTVGTCAAFLFEQGRPLFPDVGASGHSGSDSGDIHPVVFQHSGSVFRDPVGS